MERDFLGLSSKEEPLAKVKEEIDNDGAQGYSKSSGVPPPMPFKISAEDKTAYPVAAASDQRRAADAQMAGPILKQPLGGVPVSSALNSFFPPFGSISGITEPWNSMKPTGGSPAQLTIFYGGTVKVYDDISPERAQAIMFLAGAGASISNIAHQKAQAQAHGMGAKMAAASDGAPKNQPVSTLPCPALSSPLSVSSHTGAQSGSGSSCSDELGGVKTNGLPTTPISKGEPPRIVNAVGPVAATAMLPSAVPQARKASLARFLEKRKERVMSSAPYNLSKKHPECAATESNGANFSSPITSNSANVAS
ncbi:protein TIFY 6B-like isoform X2 [Cucurbita pepo subsp. pepo]|uniref:protein TIFY 6B-like isoform X2 n=1 Tax=Cucurbita pepo subsp. pepo TaxID=3664 RepID=UPI000C9D49E4|nr:protein TIFY 6B-like isoform X2 [Cucurbita pepo subsp. pepo]